MEIQYIIIEFLLLKMCNKVVCLKSNTQFTAINHYLTVKSVNQHSFRVTRLWIYGPIIQFLC